MLAAQFLRSLEQGSVPPVCLFTGEAGFLMEEAWKRLRDLLVPPKGRRYNGERLQAKEHSAAEVVERLRVLPMFGKKRLLMVTHVEGWPEQERKALASYLAKPFPSACLVLAVQQKKGFKKLEEAVQAVGQVVFFQAPSERDLPRWLQDRAKTLKKTLTPQAAAFLVDQAGTDLHTLDRELEKAALYTGGKDKIELDDLRQTVSSVRSYTVFEMLRYVIQCRSGQALVSLGNLIDSGEHPLGILALLARQIRLLWQVKEGLGRGMSQAEIAQAIKLHPYAVKEYAGEAPNITEAELRRAHSGLVEADLAIKSSAAAPVTIMEALILSLCRADRTKKPPGSPRGL